MEFKIVMWCTLAFHVVFCVIYPISADNLSSKTGSVLYQYHLKMLGLS